MATNTSEQELEEELKLLGEHNRGISDELVATGEEVTTPIPRELKTDKEIEKEYIDSYIKEIDDKMSEEFNNQGEDIDNV